jgi:tRNA pseudouridine13 synthase
VTYLVDHPTDYRGAFARLKRELRTLYFSAFQSHLWNLLLSGWIVRNTRADQRVKVDLKVGVLVFPIQLDADQLSALLSLPLPLPSARNPQPEGPLSEVTDQVLSRFALSWNDLRVRRLKDVFLSKGTRPAMVFPRNLESSLIDDELHAGRKALRMGFDLDKGSYATILVKRITEVAGAA